VTTEGGSAQDHAVARLESLERPADVIDAAARIVAERLSDEKFVWVKSRNIFRRTVSERHESFTIDRSRWNRSGSFIAFSVAALTVMDDGLRAWRMANPTLTPERPPSVLGIVAAASFYDMSRTAEVILTRAGTRADRLAVWCDHIRQTAIPWFISTRDPESIAEVAPDALLDPWGFAVDLVEYLIYRDHPDQARRLIERVLAQGQQHQQGFELGRAMARRNDRASWHSAESLGWSSTMLGLA
jgi:hypothetical protein